MDAHDYLNSGADEGASPVRIFFLQFRGGILLVLYLQVINQTPSECHASRSMGKNKASSGRKNKKWGRHEHTVFIHCCEEAIVVGHREGKCFTAAGWGLIIGWLKERTGQEWSQDALLNHWNAMRKDHTHLFEFLNCNGVTYDQHLNAVVAPDHWWESKIQIRPAYKKFRTMNCKEIYEDYSRLFGDTYNSDKFALTPTKIGRKGGFLYSGYGKPGPSNDAIPVSAEMSDESDGGDVNEIASAMEFSQPRSGDKPKGSTSGGKQKKKGTRDSLFESAHKLASLGEDLCAERARAREICPSCAECIKELKTAGLLQQKTRMYNFALNFLTAKSNREGYAACDTVDEKWDWLVYSFEEYCATKK